jgi:hypothetical protein
MTQRKDPQSKSQVQVEIDDRVAIALQQYNDTDGHFSLVRWDKDLQPLGSYFMADSGAQKFSTS